MLILLFVFFGVSFLGMIILPLRHVHKVRSDADIEAGPTSVVRVHVSSFIEWADRWYRERTTHEFLKLVDGTLKLCERAAGKMAGQTKQLRFMVQERFRVIPRESLYWKQIHSWKKGNKGALAFADWEEDTDISNHLEK